MEDGLELKAVQFNPLKIKSSINSTKGFSQSSNVGGWQIEILQINNLGRLLG